jgi:hydroxymethylglutaryl-CoA lyase
MTHPIHDLPRVEIVDESLREGMQIEDAQIEPAEKIRLLDALSAAGLPTLIVGSFVSPTWVPQMARVEEVIAGFTPREGTTYTALALNARGAERRTALTAPHGPLSVLPDVPRSTIHLCDVFVRRNTNKSQADEIAALPRTIAAAVERGVTEATVAINAAWGSNWLGRFSLEQRLAYAAYQYDAWTAAGIAVTTFWIGDPMSWNTPRAMEETIAAFRERWPEVKRYHLHLHDARGTALTSFYQALRGLTAEHTLGVDVAIGGMGGCPYCGNGRATKMIPTEDLVDLLHEEGVETGIDLGLLIEAAHLAEEVVGHELYGKVSKAGPRPRGAQLYPMDMPFVESTEQAQHFRLGAEVYADAPSPYQEPITSAARDAIEAGLPVPLQVPVAGPVQSQQEH